MTSSEIRAERKILNNKYLALGLVITLVFCILPLASMMWCWSMTKFPPQIFGNNEDHFRAHVINPIPESVEILDVEFDDIIIQPDTSYYFRFSVNRDDLTKIISYNSLEPANECPALLSPPEWWDISAFDDVETYEYIRSGEVVIILCYHVPSKTAYYLFRTF